MSHKIDETTGLPELPEEQFWRVEHPVERVFPNLYSMIGYPGTIVANKSKLIICLFEWLSEPRTTTTKRFLRKPIVVTEFAFSSKCLRVEDVKGMNPIAILNAANRIMNLIEKERVIDALIGDYPPKKLEV